MSRDTVYTQSQKSWVNEYEVGQFTGLSVHTLRAHRFQRRGIPYSKVGRSVRYKLEDVIAYMDKHRIALTD